MIPKNFPESKSISVALARMEAELSEHKEFVAFMKAYSHVCLPCQIESELEVEEVRA